MLAAGAFYGLGEWVPDLKIVLKRKAPLCLRGMAGRGLEGLGEGDISSASRKR